MKPSAIYRWVWDDVGFGTVISIPFATGSVVTKEQTRFYATTPAPTEGAAA